VNDVRHLVTQSITLDSKKRISGTRCGFIAAK